MRLDERVRIFRSCFCPPLLEHFVAKWDHLALKNAAKTKPWSVSVFPWKTEAL